MATERIEILVLDRKLEEIALIGIGARRKTVLRRWDRPPEASGQVTASVGFAMAADFPSLPRLEPARWSRWSGCVVFVEPETPAEALSRATRVASDARSKLLFVSLHDPAELLFAMPALIERLYLGLRAERILHAWWSGTALEFVTTEFEHASIPRRSVPELRRVGRNRCRDVDVSRDGSRVWFPAAELVFDADDLLDLAIRDTEPGSFSHTLAEGGRG